MARKRHKKPNEHKSRSQSKADWKHDDEIELLACLEYILSTTKDAGSSMSIFVDHLEKSRHTKYTVPQIERKIRKFWITNHHDDATDSDEIYKLGLKCLPRLPNELRTEIEERLNTLKDQTLAARLQSRRQLRSASRTTDSELSRHISLGVEVTDTPSPRKRHREPLSTSAAIDEPRPRKRRDAHSQPDQVPNGYTAQKLPKQEDEADPIGPQFVLRVVDDSQDELSADEGRDSPTNRLSSEHRSSLLAADVGETLRKNNIEHLEDLRSKEEQQDFDLEDQQRELVSCQKPCEKLQEAEKQSIETIDSLRHQLSITEGECKELKRQVACLEDARGQLSQSEKSIIETLNANDKEISELQEALNNKERLRSFSTLSFNDPMPLDARKAAAEMASIGDTIKRMMSGYEDNDFCTPPSFEGRNELHSLFRRSFSLDPPGPSISISQTFDLSNFSFQAILRTLVASALCEWVFESDLHDISEKPCALLKKYRLHLDMQDGEITLRNLDFAAHTSLIEEEFFQEHVIPARASVLADRLIRTLAPLFVHPVSLQDLHGEVLKTWSAKKWLLKEVFEGALRIKAQATVSKDFFGMVLYSPGTLFDKGVMGSETMEGGRAKAPCSTTPRVKLCLLPSLHVYENDRKIVDYNNFVRRPNGQSSTAIKLTKAIVILESAQTTNS